jgi:molybdopterin synthase catalytic subunit
MIRITRNDFSIDIEIRNLKRKSCGALCIFVGTVRKERGLKEIEIETYKDMAKRKLGEIERKALERFDIKRATIIHRTGSLALGDNILFIGVGAGHRKAAFAACRFILEEIKKSVPIWKKEIFEGREGWVM